MEKTIPQPVTAAGSKHVLDRIRNMELFEIPHPVILSFAKDLAPGARFLFSRVLINPPGADEILRRLCLLRMTASRERHLSGKPPLPKGGVARACEGGGICPGPVPP